MAMGPARMPLLEHLGELRTRIFNTVILLIICIVIFYLATPAVGQFLLLPIKDCIPTDADGNAILSVLDPFEAFGTRFKLAVWSAVVATAPFILWQILAFLLPALKPKERKWFIPSFVAAVLLFIVGTLFCYGIVLHPAFTWLTDQAGGLGVIDARMSSYIDMILKFELGFGLAFEMPLFVFYLVVFDIVPYKKIRGAWRYVYVVLIVLSAMITPDASPVTMLLMFAAMVLLYEGSLFIAKIALRSKIKRQNEELRRQEEELAEWEQTKAELKRKYRGED